MFAREASRGTLLTVLLLLGIPPLLEAQDYADASRPLWSGMHAVFLSLPMTSPCVLCSVLRADTTGCNRR